MMRPTTPCRICLVLCMQSQVTTALPRQPQASIAFDSQEKVRRDTHTHIHTHTHKGKEKEAPEEEVEETIETGRTAEPEGTFCKGMVLGCGGRSQLDVDLVESHDIAGVSIWASMHVHCGLHYYKKLLDKCALVENKKHLQ